MKKFTLTTYYDIHSKQEDHQGSCSSPDDNPDPADSPGTILQDSGFVN